MAEGPNGKLTWWLLGIFATLIILGLSFLVSSITGTNSRISTIEILGVTSAERVKHIEESTKNLVADRIDVLTKNSELLNKITSVESSIKLLDNRVSTMSERLLTINTRIDALAFHDKIKESIKDKGNEK